MQITDLLTVAQVRVPLRAKSRDEALGELAELLGSRRGAAPIQAVANALRAREAVSTTAVEHGVALPHARVEGIDGVQAAIALAPDGIQWGDRSVTIAVMLVSAPSAAPLHLKALAKIARLLHDPGAVARVIAARTDEELFAVIKREESANP